MHLNIGLWPLISYAVCIKSNKSFRAISLQQPMAWIQLTFLRTIKPRWDSHLVSLPRLDPSSPSYGPWSIMQYAFRGLIVSVLFLCNNWQELEPLIPRWYSQIFSLISYANVYTAIIVSALFSVLEFNGTSWEPSISRRDAHIVALLRSDPPLQSNGPWLVMQYANRAIIVSCYFLLHKQEHQVSTFWLLC
jgi:hypothetical protein